MKKKIVIMLTLILVTGTFTACTAEEKMNNDIKTSVVSTAEVEIVKRNELHTFVVLPKRWIVERSFAWLDKCRRLWKNCKHLFKWLLRFLFVYF